jgi:glycosyltransferase involved in cell wall biosynthesis
LNHKVVHCNNIQGLLHTGLGARAAGAAVVFNIRDVKPPDEQYSWKWRAVWLSNQLLVLSEEMHEALSNRLPIKTHGNKGKSHIESIYSMVDLEQMRPVSQTERQVLRTRLGIAQGRVALGYIAAFNEKKEQLRFIEQAGPLIKEKIPKATMYFIGDFDPKQDAYARACQRAVHHLQLQEVFSFIGYTTEVADWYKALDMVIIASRREGLARCMIESLACGTPVVSFNVCSAREILEQHNCGRVVPQGNYAELIEQVAGLADSPAMLCALGTNGSVTARQLFDPALIMKQYERLYGDLANEARR